MEAWGDFAQVQVTVAKEYLIATLDQGFEYLRQVVLHGLCRVGDFVAQLP